MIFNFFSKYQYFSRFTFYQKLKNTLHNALAETFFWLLAKLHFKISNLLKIAKNDECTCDLNATSIENVRFRIKFEENWKDIPIENNWFLANFKQNSYGFFYRKSLFLDYFWRKFIGLPLSESAHFWLFWTKIHRVTPIENTWFLAIFDGNS